MLPRELFNLVVPLQPESTSKGDNAQMAYRGRTMANLDTGDRLLPAPDAIEEVSHVVLAVIQTVSAFGQGSREKRTVAGAQVAAIDPDPTRGPLKPDPVSLSLRVVHSAVDIIGLSRANVMHDAIAVREFCVVFADGGVAAGDRLC